MQFILVEAQSSFYFSKSVPTVSAMHLESWPYELLLLNCGAVELLSYSQENEFF